MTDKPQPDPYLYRTRAALAAFDEHHPQDDPGLYSDLAEAVGLAYGKDTCDINNIEVCRACVRPGRRVPPHPGDLSFVRRMVQKAEERERQDDVGAWSTAWAVNRRRDKSPDEHRVPSGDVRCPYDPHAAVKDLFAKQRWLVTTTWMNTGARARHVETVEIDKHPASYMRELRDLPYARDVGLLYALKLHPEDPPLD